MAARNLEVKGLNQIIRNLDALPQRIKKKAVNQSLKASAKPIVKLMKNEAPKSSGQLRKSIAAVPMKRKDPNRFAIKIGPRYGGKITARYAHIVEFGSERTSPNPFIRPAFNKGENKFFSTFYDDINDRIIKEVKLLARKGKVR